MGTMRCSVCGNCIYCCKTGCLEGVAVCLGARLVHVVDEDVTDKEAD